MGEYLWYAELAGARLASADFDTFVLPSDVSDVEQAHQNAAFVAPWQTFFRGCDSHRYGVSGS